MKQFFSLFLILLFWVSLIGAEELSREEWLAKDKILHSKGMGAYKKGDYKASIEFFLESVIIREKVLGKEHTSTAISYNNIGSLYESMGDYPKALSYYQKSLAIREKVLSKEHTSTATSYNNIGLLYQTMGDYPKALSYYQKSLAIKEKVLGKEHTSTAISYNNIGELYKTMGDYPKALSYYQKVITIFEKVLGKEHTSTATSYSNIGYLHKLTKNYPQAHYYAQKSFNIFIKNRDKNFKILDNKQKELYLKSNNLQVPLLLSTAHLHSEHNATKEKQIQISQQTFNSWLAYKGSIFDSEDAISTLYDNTKDKALKAKIDELLSNKRRLAKLYQTPARPKQQKEWKANIKEVEEHISTLTNAIANKAQSFKEAQGLDSISYKDISSNLKEDELYIDYAKAGKYYYLFSLDSKEHITFGRIDENSTKEIDNLIKTFRDDIHSIINDKSLTATKLSTLTTESKEKLTELYKLLLGTTLSKEIKDKKSLVISPDGALRLFPFEAMFDSSKDKYLIEQKQIRYIPSGKELIRLYRYAQTNTATNPQATIFSNPNFDYSVKKEKVPKRNREDVIMPLAKLSFNPLPGTEAEANAVKTIVSSQEPISYSKDQASEA